MVEADRLMRSPIHKGSAQKGLGFIDLAQNSGSGWRYGVKAGMSDAHLTARMALPLVGAQRINQDAHAREGSAAQAPAGCDRWRARPLGLRGGDAQDVWSTALRDVLEFRQVKDDDPCRYYGSWKADGEGQGTELRSPRVAAHGSSDRVVLRGG